MNEKNKNVLFIGLIKLARAVMEKKWRSPRLKCELVLTQVESVVSVSLCCVYNKRWSRVVCARSVVFFSASSFFILFCVLFSLSHALSRSFLLRQFFSAIRLFRMVIASAYKHTCTCVWVCACINSKLKRVVCEFAAKSLHSGRARTNDVDGKTKCG